MGRGRHLTYSDRLRIEALVKAGVSKRKMAEVIGCCLATVYYELARGQYERLDSEYRTVTAYSADIAQADHDNKATGKGPSLKIGADHEFAAYLEASVKKEKLSPDVALGRLRLTPGRFKTTICTTTFYHYIDRGLFLNLSRKDLFYGEKHHRKQKNNTKANSISAVAPLRQSIAERPSEIASRSVFGHWEMDTVVGNAKGKNSVLLVLTERLTRYEIVTKIRSKTQLEVKRALDRLERKFSDFPERFKSITMDNGCEFVNPELIEDSCRRKGRKRTAAYYCHPYSSWERGSNENQNRLIRRHIPKGAPIDYYTPRQVQYIADWMNDLPRKILGYHTPRELYEQYTAALSCL